MVVLGAFILPHGATAFYPGHFETIAKDEYSKQLAWQLNRASVEVGKQIIDLKPDLLLLSTPHGIADLSQFLFYLNGQASGSTVADFRDSPPAHACDSIQVKLADDHAKALVLKLQAAGLTSVSGLSFFTGYGPCPLRWGEVIPLLFVKELLSTTKAVILSQPAVRGQKAVEIIPQLLLLGAKLFEELDALSVKVVVIISGDLSHAHVIDGPRGYSTEAEPFDQACGEWAKTLQSDQLLNVAAGYVEKAFSCGYTGFVMLHGMLQETSPDVWLPTLHANCHPDYYGMMVASFRRKP